jgi:putative ABC transport system permease protein
MEMRKVENKKVIRSIAFRMMKADKKKTITVIFAVILTTILFTVLFSVGMSMIETTQRSTMRQVGGSAMAGLEYAQETDYEILKKDDRLKDISYRIVVGNLCDPALEELVTEVYYSTDENARMCFSYPTAGKMPEKENEIVLSTLTMDKLGIKQELGQAVPLELQIGENVIKKEFVLCGYYEGDVVAMSQMAYVSKKYQEEAAPEPEESYYDVPASDITGYWMIDFNFFHSFFLKKQTQDLLLRNGYDLEKVFYGINWAYAFYDVDTLDIVLEIVILCFILLAGYLIIYNIFSISIVSDIHAYGLLKTIGTSGKQLKKMVWMQAVILAAVGIFCGLIAGTLISNIVFPIILSTTSMDADDMVISMHPLIYIFATLFSFFTVAAGCRKSGTMAGKVSPVEAVSYHPVLYVKKKQRRTKKVSIRKLALENVGREKKRTTAVILSLALSVLLVNGIYAAVKGLDADQYVSQSIIGDFNIADMALYNTNVFLDETKVVTQDDISYLEQLDGVKKCSNIYCDMDARTDMPDAMEKKICDLLGNDEENYWKEAVDIYLSERYINCDYYGIDEVPLDYMTIYKGEIDQTLWETGKYAIYYSYQMINEEGDLTDCVNIGDEILVTLQNGKQKSYQVMAIAEMPYAMSKKAYSLIGSQVIVPEQEYLANEEKKGALLSVIEAEKEKQAELQETLSAYTEQSDSLTLVSKQTYLGEFENFVRKIELVGGGLTVVLAVIGIMNFVNSVVTGICRREQELAMMQAVGLTDRQMTGMLIWEGMIQGIGTILAAGVVFAVFGGLLFGMVENTVWFFRYHFTLVPMLGCLPFVMMIAAGVPLAACYSMKKRSLVERMRG